ncbi:hypothetical protein CJ179_38785 [Rhodococcus sp. ACS1]|uniref:hypothetical protein n=1 Tax=Rhodococcus sp. ACS1 TaxID=2028570 RepID=UPI000BB0F4D4|nr:hypothetical protein [Rhodococcus sp. ACS1]PBC38546.1 hypothetical protein CJ179_38785 [Rhodococcus sp. ACS1]
MILNKEAREALESALEAADEAADEVVKIETCRALANLVADELNKDQPDVTDALLLTNTLFDQLKFLDFDWDRLLEGVTEGDQLDGS